MKFNKIVIFTAIMFLCSPVLAATTDFITDGNITVSSVTFGSSTADLIIFSGSASESLEYSSGNFTVTNPDSTNIFKIGSSDTRVKSIRATKGGEIKACADNFVPGTSYVELPSVSGTYTIVPSDIVDCTTLCPRLHNVATYNFFPTCGAATCNSGYVLQGSGSSATCIYGGGSVIYYDTNLEVEEEIEEEPSEESEESSDQVSDVPGVPARDSQGNVTLAQMSQDAIDLLTGNVDLIASLMGMDVNISQEAIYNETITSRIVDSDTPEDLRRIINLFVTYGTKSTKFLGAGERGGVVNSFKAAFGRLPTTFQDWNDVMKIANGRWPNQRSEEAENSAKEMFKKIYLREANMDQPNDNAAVTVMAYGLRPANRNMNSEKAAITIFKNIFGYNPSSATDWDAIRAIAYSGAVR